MRPQAPRGTIEPSTQSGQFQLQRAQRCVFVRGRCKLNTNRQPSLKQTTQQKECEFLPKIWHYLYGLMGRCAEPGWISTRYTWFGRSNPSQNPPLPSRPTWTMEHQDIFAYACHGSSWATCAQGYSPRALLARDTAGSPQRVEGAFLLIRRPRGCLRCSLDCS